MTPAFWILIAAGAVLSLQIARLGRRWAIGAAADVDIVAGLRRLPRVYLHDVHTVVEREPGMSRMHALVAGGTLSAVVCTLAAGATGWRILALLAGIAAAAGIIGAGLDAWRRRRSARPDRLSGAQFDRLPFALLTFDAGLLLSAVGVWTGPVAVYAGAIFLALGAGWLVARAARGPMRHAVAGVTALVAHPRPERFDAGPHATALKPALEGYGIGRAEDFGWNRLAMFDACVQCGKCEAACPAYAAGQPLNPKKLINDLVIGLGGDGAGTVRSGPDAQLGTYGTATGAIGTEYSGHGHPAPMGPLDDLIDGLGGGSGTDRSPRLVATETLWSCTTCRACVEACPMMIEHVDAIVDLRRHETLTRGVPPLAVGAVLLDLAETDTQSGRALSERHDWAADLGLRVLSSDGDACEVLLWAGESAYDMRSQSTLRALVRLLQRAGIDLAILGTEERDCGDFARRAGDEATFAALARTNRATLSRHRIGRIVSADPHVVHCLAREYPSFGPMPDVVHHSTLLDALMEEGRLTVPPLPDADAVTYHDPCYLGRYMGETGAPRRILRRLGLISVEMTDHGRSSRCCGGGGGAALADVPGRRRIPDVRMDQARATGAQTVVAACPNCTQMLEGVPGAGPQVRDLAELVWQAVEATP